MIGTHFHVSAALAPLMSVPKEVSTFLDERRRTKDGWLPSSFVFRLPSNAQDSIRIDISRHPPKSPAAAVFGDPVAASAGRGFPTAVGTAISQSARILPGIAPRALSRSGCPARL